MAIGTSSGNRFEATGAPVTDHPLTIAAWGYLTGSLSTRTLVNIGVSGGDNTSLRMNSSGAILATSLVSGAANNAISSATTTANTWFHAAGVFASATSRSAYLDGDNKGTNTNSKVIVASYNFTQLGARSSAEPWIGYIAEIAVWNHALTDAEITSLATGIRSSLIRPDKLVFYCPGIREVNDVARGLTLSAVGSPTVQDHPRRIG